MAPGSKDNLETLEGELISQNDAASPNFTPSQPIPIPFSPDAKDKIHQSYVRNGINAL